VNNHTISSTKATIIIAAYNETTVIRKALTLLSNADFSHEYQIIVVCNGCNDGTEKVVQNEFKNIHCYSLEQASKALAIRYAESLNPGFPRLYLDADIELQASDVVWLINYAAQYTVPALIVPGSIAVVDDCDALVKSFYRAWYNTRHVRSLGFGAGAYLLNHTGRKRFDDWPELMADDGFIRTQFRADEIHITQSCRVRVKAPKSLLVLLKVKTRSKLGNLELKNYLKHIGRAKLKQPATIDQVSTKLKWYDRVVYLSVNIAALVLAKWQYSTGKKVWHRDSSNR